MDIVRLIYDFIQYSDCKCSEDFRASKGAQNTELGTNTDECKKDFVKLGKKFWSIVMKMYNSVNILIMLPSCSFEK